MGPSLSDEEDIAGGTTSRTMLDGQDRHPIAYVTATTPAARCEATLPDEDAALACREDAHLLSKAALNSCCAWFRVEHRFEHVLGRKERNCVGKLIDVHTASPPERDRRSVRSEPREAKPNGGPKTRYRRDRPSSPCGSNIQLPRGLRLAKRGSNAHVLPVCQGD
jgi:hypothetical protein